MIDYIGEGDVKVLWGEDIKPVTDQASVIMGSLVPQWAREFLLKNRKYREVDNSLGARGVFPDIWRKTGILKSRIWLGHGVTGESTREVIRDLIGHLFLMLYMLDTEAERDVELAEGQDYALGAAARRIADELTGEQNYNFIQFDLLPAKQASQNHVYDEPRFDPEQPVRQQLLKAAESLPYETLKKAIANAQRGHRPHEWEEVATRLARAASHLLEFIGQNDVHGPLAAAWEQGYVAADNGHDNDNPYVH